MNFVNACTPYPICTPARATMWTGVLPHAHGCTYNRYRINDVLDYEGLETRTLFADLRASGVTTAYFGKWHLGEDSSHRVDHWDGFNSQGGHWEDGYQSFQDGKYRPEAQTDRMIDWLRSDAARQPFVAVQSYYPPHNPFTAPTEFYEPYRGKGIPSPGYYAAVSALDSYVGRLRACLEEEGLAEDTLVIFLSDHGETFDLDPRKPHKCVCHDTALRVPMLMCGAGVEGHGRRVHLAVGIEDLGPTILDAAGVAVPDRYHGRSLLEAQREPSDWRDAHFAQNDLILVRTPQRAIRTERWKLILSMDEAHELYDLNVDPEELLNVYATPREHFHCEYEHFPDHRPQIEALTRRILTRAKEVGDDVGVSLAGRVLRQKAYEAEHGRPG